MGLLGINTKVALTPWCQTYFSLTNWLLLMNCFFIGVIAKFEWKTPSVRICARCDLPFLVRISGPLLLLVPMFLPPLCPSRRRRGGQFVIRASLGMASAPRSASGTAMGSELNLILVIGRAPLLSAQTTPHDDPDRPIMHSIIALCIVSVCNFQLLSSYHKLVPYISLQGFGSFDEASPTSCK